MSPSQKGSPWQDQLNLSNFFTLCLFSSSQKGQGFVSCAVHLAPASPYNVVFDKGPVQLVVGHRPKSRPPLRDGDGNGHPAGPLLIPHGYTTVVKLFFPFHLLRHIQSFCFLFGLEKDADALEVRNELSFSYLIFFCLIQAHYYLVLILRFPRSDCSISVVPCFDFSVSISVALPLSFFLYFIIIPTTPLEVLQFEGRYPNRGKTPHSHTERTVQHIFPQFPFPITHSWACDKQCSFFSRLFYYYQHLPSGLIVIVLRSSTSRLHDTRVGLTESFAVGTMAFTVISYPTSRLIRNISPQHCITHSFLLLILT